MDKPKVDHIRIVNIRPGHVMTGNTTKIYLNGELLNGACKLEFLVEARKLAKVKIEMMADVEIEGDLSPEQLEIINKNEALKE